MLDALAWPACTGLIGRPGVLAAAALALGARSCVCPAGAEHGCCVLPGTARRPGLSGLHLRSPLSRACRSTRRSAIVSSFQGSRHVLSRWNAFSRVDVVEGPAIARRRG